MKIKILDSFIADKIAAGEVIERPVSVIKELVENSIDAEAGSITVEIKNGGKSYMRVSDDGTGIMSDDVETAFERHATGKISTMEDLGCIRTLGFRGEALASIAAISRLTLYTKTREESTGTKLVLHGGRKVSREKVGVADGTSFIVEDIFYNTPARRKFMKSDAAEASAIIDLIQRMAIYYSGIRFKMINNGRTILQTDGRGDTLRTIQRIYPTNDYRNLMKVQSEDAAEEISVSGFISDPGTTRKSRRNQIFFVNGRIVRSSVIDSGIEKGYGDRVFDGFPIAILFIQVPPESIDVNIHPGKREIKFLEQRPVINCIADAVRGVISSENAIPSAVRERMPSYGSSQDTADSAPAISTDEKNSTADAASSGEEPQMDIRSFLKKKREAEEQDHNDNTAHPEASQKVHHNSSENLNKKSSCDTINRGVINPQITEADEQPEQDKDESIAIDEPEIRPFSFDDLAVKGYVLDTYIITQAGDDLYILDQHAAHERINYERFISEYNSGSNIPQPVITPYQLETSPDVYNADRKWLDTVRKLGFDLEDFGNNTFTIRGIPGFMSITEAVKFIREFTDSLDDGGEITNFRDDRPLNKGVVDKLIMKSCKSAVKANDRLTDVEIKSLLEDLSKCVNPFSCPHGRPTFIKITKYDIERAFKRK